MSEEWEERCENCRFWERFYTREVIDGLCHRFPPILIKHEDCMGLYSDDFTHITTDRCDWCGEWQPVPATKMEAARHELLPVVGQDLPIKIRLQRAGILPKNFRMIRDENLGILAYAAEMAKEGGIAWNGGGSRNLVYAIIALQKGCLLDESLYLAKVKRLHEPNRSMVTKILELIAVKIIAPGPPAAAHDEKTPGRAVDAPG